MQRFSGEDLSVRTLLKACNLVTWLHLRTHHLRTHDGVLNKKYNMLEFLLTAVFAYISMLQIGSRVATQMSQCKQWWEEQHAEREVAHQTSSAERAGEAERIRWGEPAAELLLLGSTDIVSSSIELYDMPKQNCHVQGAMGPGECGRGIITVTSQHLSKQKCHNKMP